MRDAECFNWILWSLAPVLALIAVAGCSKEPAGNRSSHATNPALYGAPLSAPAQSIARVGATNGEEWKRGPFSCVQTELSPATLYHSATKYLGFFTHLADYGLGAPAFAAFNTPTGPRIHKNGEPMDVRWMEENWVLVWFNGAKGWSNWDSPWVVYLQHKPSGIKLDENGLHFEFKGAAGDVVLLPIYGYEKGSPAGNDFRAAHRLAGDKIRTWDWVKAIPREPLMRVKYWACATREFPLYCEDSFSVNRGNNTVTIRQRFRWHSIEDDWQTRHIKVAPVSPTLALAMDGQFPAEFSKPIRDFALATPYGPFMAAENVDGFDATFKVLQYVNETEAYDPPQTTNHATVQAALARLQNTARDKFGQTNRAEDDHDGFRSAMMGDPWYAKGLPYYAEPTRTTALASLQKYFHEEVLVTNRLKLHELPEADAERRLQPAADVLNRPSLSGIESLWAYAHFSGDWELVREHWDLVKKLFWAPKKMRWAGFGRERAPDLGEDAAPCLAMARLAYKVGDIDTYNYACYVFARELVHHYVKQRGAEYFRRRQPWHTMEFMDEEVYLTQLWGDVAGWQMDGPNYPTTGERQYTNRWARFNSEDVGRFYREYLKEDTRRELDRLMQRWEPKRKYENEPRTVPSELQLRSLLLNDSPADLAKLATPEQFSGPASGVIGSCIAVLRTSHPTRYERLIPAGDSTPFVAGLERDVAGPNAYLAQSIRSSVEDKERKTNRTIWPEVTWGESWKTPTGHRWSFGHVMPMREGVAKMQIVPLNWNSEALVYALP